MLFDRFDARSVLGGAPFNVAWHLAALGDDPLMVSRVGDDADGRAILERMRARGMDTTGVESDPARATGSVTVTVADGEPHYDIVAGVAWDAIEAKILDPSAAPGDGPDWLYHGTLAARGERTAASLARLRRRAARVFVDVNLRPPFDDAATVLPLVEGVDALKLNADELDRLEHDLALDGSLPTDRALEHRMRRLAARLDVPWLVVTRGAAGATLLAGEQVLHAAPPALEARVVDTVGAGDAFAAVALHGLLHGWSPDTLLERALRLAARVCRHRGATHDDPSLYAGLEPASASPSPRSSPLTTSKGTS